MRNNVIGSKIVGTRIAWVNMLERKDFLIRKGNRCLSADDIALRIMISMGIGTTLLLLRVMIFGLPPMTEQMLRSTSLAIAGIIMYWPIYVVASAIPLMIIGVFQKRKIEKELKEVSQQMDDYRLCW